MVLETLFDIVCEALPKNEYIWEQSAPPPIKSEEEIQLASFGPKGQDKEMYREHLAREYGKKGNCIVEYTIISLFQMRF